MEAERSAPSKVEAPAFESDAGTALWLANITAETSRVAIDGLAGRKVSANARPADPVDLVLAPYCVCRLDVTG